MKVLLTGASGFLGSYVLKALQRHNIDVVAVGRTLPQVPTKFIEADLLSIHDFAPLIKQAQPTHLLHLAWYAEHGKYWNSSLNLRWTETTIRLVEAFCAAGGRHIVLAGTCAEYDWTQGYCQEDTSLLNPATLYGVAKDATRRLAMAVCAQHHTSCAWGRIFLPFGHGENFNRLIPSLIDVFQGTRRPFELNALAYRDFLHASDVAEGFIKLLMEKVQGEYNICSGEPIRLSEVVTTLASFLDADPAVILELANERPHEPALLIGKNAKLKALGWQPAYTLMQGFERTLQGELK
jgi:nucleoside-diphosphate-sugar epimerase